jgi:hypothetical protein
VCSTSDEGYIKQDVWLAKYNEMWFNVIPIAACSRNGKATDYSSETTAKYGFQDEQIDASNLDKTPAAVDGTVSGSSVATAMASGIASLILACQQMLYSFDPPTKEDSGYKAVANVLPSIVAKGTKNPPPVQPWHVLPNDKDSKWLFSNDYFRRWIRVK